MISWLVLLGARIGNFTDIVNGTFFICLVGALLGNSINFELIMNGTWACFAWCHFFF